MAHLKIIQHWFRWWIGAGQATRHSTGSDAGLVRDRPQATHDSPVRCRKYASPSLNELNLSQTPAAHSPFHVISASWHFLEFQPITGALTLQCGSLCCYVRQAAGGLKGNTLKTCCWKQNDGCSLCVYTGKSDRRYRPKGSGSGKNSENVKKSEGHRALLVLSMFASHTRTTQSCYRCPAQHIKLQRKCYQK